jgi:hypothetical protein
VVIVAADRLGKIALTDGDVMIADQESEVREAWRAVANAKLAEYRRQAWRLAHLARKGSIQKVDAVDGLWEIALAHALVRALGEDRVQAILSEAFAGTECRPMLQHSVVA